MRRERSGPRCRAGPAICLRSLKPVRCMPSFRRGAACEPGAAIVSSSCDEHGGLAELDAPREPPHRGAPPKTTFHSILDHGLQTGAPDDAAEMPEFFRDLNLDQIVAAITAGKEEYDLKPFFYRRLADADDIAYRQEVMQDLEDPRLFAAIDAFAEQMQEMRSRLRGVEKGYYRWQTNAWFLDAA